MLLVPWKITIVSSEEKWKGNKEPGGKGKTRYVMKQDVAPSLGLTVWAHTPACQPRSTGSKLSCRDCPELVFT